MAPGYLRDHLFIREFLRILDTMAVDGPVQPLGTLGLAHKRYKIDTEYRFVE